MPNKDYWDKKRLPKTERIVLLPLPEPNSRTSALLSGQVDWIEQPSPDAVPQLKSAGMQISSNPYPHVWPYHPSLLPESPFLYPEDEISTQNLRFFVAELIRETALEQLEDEVPYSIACAVEEFREDRKPLYIRAVLYVERESQKRILIGAKGQRIREMGRAARAKVEAFLDTVVYLDLWLKVLPNWRKNAQSLNRLGYRLPEERSS